MRYSKKIKFKRCRKEVFSKGVRVVVSREHVMIRKREGVRTTVRIRTYEGHLINKVQKRTE